MIRVMVVDDSAVLRQSIKFILESDAELRVVGQARNGEEAVALASQLRPDIITMDIKMPKMGGLDAIRTIMSRSPVPIVVVTSADLERDPVISSQATKLGAVSVLRRPTSIAAPNYRDFATNLVQQVRTMSEVKVIRRRPTPGTSLPGAGVRPPTTHPAVVGKTEVIAIGSSTGGPAALHKVLADLTVDCRVPILIVQHIAFGFVEGLAGWLDGISPLQVKVAKKGEPLRPGVVYIAPDGQHMEVGFGRIRLNESEPVRSHRPSVTTLFGSVARAYGPGSVSAILTGMGDDGAAGMRALSDAGATTIAQDEKSCVVFGMPKEAIALGAVRHVVPLEKIARTLMALCRT